MTLLLEYWKPIVGWEESYEVSVLGTVRRLKKSQGARAGKIISPCIINKGYPMLNLWRAGKCHHYLVHRLVTTTFLGLPPINHEVHHIDSNRKNPRLSNLTYVTSSQNNYYAKEEIQRKHGVRQMKCKLTPEAVKEIYMHEYTISHRKIGRIYGISGPTVSAIRAGRSWAWLTKKLRTQSV